MLGSFWPSARFGFSAPFSKVCPVPPLDWGATSPSAPLLRSTQPLDWATTGPGKVAASRKVPRRRAGSAGEHHNVTGIHYERFGSNERHRQSNCSRRSTRHRRQVAEPRVFRLQSASAAPSDLLPLVWGAASALRHLCVGRRQALVAVLRGVRRGARPKASSRRRPPGAVRPCGELGGS